MEASGTSTATPAAVPEPQSLKAPSEYVILERVKPAKAAADGGSMNTAIPPPRETWEKVGLLAARSAEVAIKKYAEGVAATSPAVLVAVPSRSFAPVRVTPKVATTLVIEEA